jgi:hypothetical protein
MSKINNNVISQTVESKDSYKSAVAKAFLNSSSMLLLTDAIYSSSFLSTTGAGVGRQHSLIQLGHHFEQISYHSCFPTQKKFNDQTCNPPNNATPT